MQESNDRFNRAEAKYLKGQLLDSNELACMEQSLASSDARNAIIAAGALLRDASANSLQKESSREVIKKFCSPKLIRSMTKELAHSLALELSITLLCIPLEELQTNEVKEFIYNLMRAEIFTERANGIAILERLGRQGDEQAISLLQNATHDSNEVVRQSASDILKRLESFS